MTVKQLTDRLTQTGAEYTRDGATFQLSQAVDLRGLESLPEGVCIKVGEGFSLTSVPGGIEVRNGDMTVLQDPAPAFWALANYQERP